jgi:hypothetical protein
MNRSFRNGLACLAATAAFCLAAGELPPTRARPPRLAPDYTDTVIPPNIAPLNFRVEEAGERYRVEFRSTRGEPIVLTSRTSSIRIPLKPWRTLLQANAGEPLYYDVSVRDAQARWNQFPTVTNQIAREEIESHLAYRLLKPLYNTYVNLGIYQRDLESFEQRPVLENQKIGGNCLNCHTFLNRRPDTFALHIRSSTKGRPMLLVRSNEVTRIDKTMGYLSWHPSGRLLAFSANKLSLFFHTRSDETREVFDALSHLSIYRVDSNTVATPAPMAKLKRNDTWPAWSPDGRYLYYCSAAPLPIKRAMQVRYDLMRISYDLERDRWGEPEVMVSAAQSGLSAAQPKVSPDGRWVLFCLCKYGNFPIYQPSSDLYALDPATRQYRRLEINSEQADSWHCWSGNSRWIVFSSKRLDGLFARPFFSYVDEQGRFHKPFLLPQADPTFYDSFAKTFNLPELVAGAIQVKESDLAAAVLRPSKVLVPKEETEQAPEVGERGLPGYREAPK